MFLFCFMMKKSLLIHHFKEKYPMKKKHIIFLISLYTCALQSSSFVSMQEIFIKVQKIDAAIEKINDMLTSIEQYKEKLALEKIKMEISALYAAEKKELHSIKKRHKTIAQKDEETSSFHYSTVTLPIKHIPSLHKSKKIKRARSLPHKKTKASQKRSVAAPISEIAPIEFRYELDENIVALLSDTIPPTSPITGIFEEETLYNINTACYDSHFFTQNLNNKNY